MPAARQLVEEKKYSEAVKVLAEVVKNQPERLDEVEALMSVIRNARNLYNSNYSELLQLLKKENLTDQDITTAYNLINEMEKLDAAPDQAIIGSFDKARRTIVFRYNDMQFNDIMDRALALMNEGRYWETLPLYSSAVGIHRDLFAEDYEEETVGETDAAASAIKGLAASLAGFGEQYTAASQRAFAESSKAGQQPPAENQYDNLVSVTERMALRREEAALYAAEVEKLKNDLLREGEYDIPYLTVMNRVIIGRSGAGRNEGILAAVDSIWEDAISENYLVLDNKHDEFFRKGENEFRNSQYSQAEESFLLAAAYSDTAKKLRSLSGFSISPAGGAALGEKEIGKVYSLLPEYIDSEKKTTAATDYAALSGIMRETGEIERVYPETESFETLLSYRDTILTDNSVIRISRSAWNENLSSLRNVSETNLSVDKTIELAEKMEEIFGQYENTLSELAVRVVRTGVDMVYEPLSDELESYVTDAAGAFSMVDGSSMTIGAGDEAYTAIVKYPAEAMDIFTRIITDMAGTETGLRQLAGLIDSAGGNAASHPLLAERKEDAAGDITEISDLREKIDTYMQRAGELLTQAEIFRNQGNRYLGEARSNMERLDFTEARERLQLARESYLNSLSYNEDRELRETTDREIDELSEEIIRQQTLVVIDTVRKNLVQAKDLYIRERFGDAENLLINSQTMWRTVNAEDNSEVEYWLNLVQTALSVRSGRVIAETDPLYNEMTQVLNLVRNDYLNALEADEAGKRDEMLGHLAAAEEKLLYVSIPFPLNQEASVLSLKILKLKDKENFDSLFRERFEQARQRIDINPAETYTTLKDLQVINPDYPGMSQAIYQTEIKLGMRTPPPDPAKIREAETLYQRAFAIVRSNVRSNYPTALAYLDRAFSLNPDDTKITTLKDRVQAEMGGTTTVVLSSYAQQQYRLAEQEFINGNYYASLAIVEKLLQDSRNRNYSPLVELKRRIDSKI